MALVTLNNLDAVAQSLKEACPDLADKAVWDARVDELVGLARDPLQDQEAKMNFYRNLTKRTKP